MFRCNLKMIRHDYPNLHKWLLHIYWDESPEETRGAFYNTTHFRDVSSLKTYSYCLDEEGSLTRTFTQIKGGYAKAARTDVVPMGPLPNVMPKGSA